MIPRHLEVSLDCPAGIAVVEARGRDAGSSSRAASDAHGSDCGWAHSRELVGTPEGEAHLRDPLRAARVPRLQCASWCWERPRLSTGVCGPRWSPSPARSATAGSIGFISNTNPLASTGTSSRRGRNGFPRRRTRKQRPGGGRGGQRARAARPVSTEV